MNPKKLVERPESRPESRPEARAEGAERPAEASEGVSGELAALADKLQMLERAAQVATEGVAKVSTFQPPARRPQWVAKGPRSAKALEALQREVNVLEAGRKGPFCCCGACRRRSAWCSISLTPWNLSLLIQRMAFL